jgi:hypothetical protein
MSAHIYRHAIYMEFMFGIQLIMFALTLNEKINIKTQCMSHNVCE